MATDVDPTNLHDLAVDAQTDLHKLAVGLAHAGAQPQAVQQLTKMADMIGDVVKALGAAANGAGPQAGPPQAGPPQAGPPGPPPGPPQPGPQGPPPPGQAYGAMHAAAHGLHQMMQAAASQRRP